MVNRLLPPVLTRRRMWIAYCVALATDAVQFFLTPLGPAGWFLDEAIDVVTMVILTATLGFHPLLLPTFILKSLPLVEGLPTWTGCTAIVVALRRKARPVAPPPAPPPVSGDVIDI
jgi:hypothetical protein